MVCPEAVPMSCEEILEWHNSLLMTESTPYHTCSWRRSEVRVGDHRGVSHRYLPSAMEEYVRRVNFLASREDLSGFNKAAWCAFYMVTIHPFMDGNGRLSRVMAVWALAQHGWRKELCFIPLFGQRVSRRQYVQSIRDGRACRARRQ